MSTAGIVKHSLLFLTVLIVSCSPSDRTSVSVGDNPDVAATESSAEDALESDRSITSGTTRKPLAGDVTLVLEITELTDNRVQLHGVTNLPTDTSLGLSIKEKMEGGFHGQSSISVSPDGSFKSNTFGPSSGLKDGLYVAKVTMPIPRVQPESVRKVIGEKGENLSGSLVKQGVLGLTLSMEKEFTIGGEQASQVQEQRQVEAAEQIESLKYEVSVLLEELIEFKDTAEFEFYGFAEGGPYHQWLKDVRTLADSTPKGANHPIPFELRVASSELMTLGMEYATKGDMGYAQQLLSEIKQTVDYDSYLATKG